MIEPVIACILTVLLPFIVGYQIIPFVPGLKRGERMGIALICGYTIVIVLLSWLGAFLGNETYKWPFAAILIIAFWGNKRARSTCIRDLIEALKDPWTTAFVLSAILWIGYINAPNLFPGAPILFEGDANHDVSHWVACADVLREQGYLSSSVAGNIPRSTFLGFAGWWSFDGRLGAELFLSWLSGLIGTHPALVYNSIAASLFWGWITGVALIARRMIGTSLPKWSWLLMVCTQPAYIFYFNFGSFPNLFGMILSSGVVVWLSLIRENPNIPRWAQYVFPSIGITAVLTTYPELLPSLVIAIFVVFTFQDHRQPKKLWQTAIRLTSIFSLSALWNPISTIRGIGTVWNKGTMSAEGRNLPDLLQNVPPINFIPSWLTIDREFGIDTYSIIGGITSILLIASIVIAAKSVKRVELGLIGLLILALITIIAEAKAVGYYYQKAIQYSAIFIYGTLLSGTIIAFKSKFSSRWYTMAYRCIGIGTTGFLFTIMCHLAYDGQKTAQKKQLPAIIFNTEQSSLSFIRNQQVFILDQSFSPYSFFFASWLPYALIDTTTFLPYSPNQQRWFHEPWWIKPEPNSPPDYLLTSSNPSNNLFAIRSKPIYADSIISIFENELGVIETPGLKMANRNEIPTEDSGFEIFISQGTDWTMTIELYLASGSNPEDIQIEFNSKNVSSKHENGFIRLTLPLGGPNGSHLSVNNLIPKKDTIWITNLSFDKNNEALSSQITGLHQWEGDFVWMGNEVKIQSNAFVDSWLNLQLKFRYPHLPENSHLIVTQEEETQSFDTNQLLTGVSIPLNPRSNDGITLRSFPDAIAPSSVEKSPDDRPLSFAFSTIDVTTSPKFSPPDSSH